MPRTARAARGGLVYHVLNRGNDRMRIFHKPADYDAFLQLLVQGRKHARIDLFGYCLMPNHWHLVIRPQTDTDLPRYLSWVTNTHVKRYRAHHHGTSGHLYQGRYKSFVVSEDGYLLRLLRYVEANPVRARLVKRAEAWRYSSLGCDPDMREDLLSEWPIERPDDWIDLVNQDLHEPDLVQIRQSIERDRPLGAAGWVQRMAARLGQEYTLRPRGRPRKEEAPRRKSRRGRKIK